MPGGRALWAAAVVAGSGAAGGCRRGAANGSAARHRPRGAHSSRAARRGRGGAGLPAAGRRLRRDVRGRDGKRHPRQGQDPAADGGGSHLRRLATGGQGHAHGRAVRQAAFGRHRARYGPAVLPRRCGQRSRADGRGAHPGSGAHGAGLPLERFDAEPAPGFRHRRFRRPASGSRLEPRLRRRLLGGGALRHARPRHRPGAVVHACDRRRAGAVRPAGGALHQP